MRISDWSSDVCSSDLADSTDTPAEVLDDLARDGKAEAGAARPLGEVGAGLLELLEDQLAVLRRHAAAVVDDGDLESFGAWHRRHHHVARLFVPELGAVRQQSIGRASVGERCCQSV